MTNGDPHNLEKYHKKAFSKLKNSENISEHNKNLLIQFHNYQSPSSIAFSRYLRTISVKETSDQIGEEANSKARRF